MSVGSSLFIGFAGKIESRRADSNRLPLLQLRVITQALQGCAEACKCRIFRGVSFLRLAECCTVLRSRWYQSGINLTVVATSDQQFSRAGYATFVAMSLGPQHHPGGDAGNLAPTDSLQYLRR
jgi:hypothetical protein